MPFLENMTLRICFIVDLFLSSTRVTSGQPEKESTSINESSNPVMSAWSIWTRLHGSTSLSHQCKVVCVKFINSLHFLHFFFLYILRNLMNIPATMLLVLSFLCGHYSTVDIIMYTFYHQFSLCFWGNYQIPNTKWHHVLSLTYVLFLYWVFLPWNNFPKRFFLFYLCLWQNISLYSM